MRASSEAMQDDIVDDRPIALRRKRRGSAGLALSTSDAQTLKSEDNNDRTRTDTVATPIKTKKRVRFSEPGTGPSVTLSTGLTPYLRRSTLTPDLFPSSPSKPRSAKARRARSLPGITSASLLSPSLSPPPTPFMSGEIQFLPLRQILDDRSKRRLRRNNLSEEINEIGCENGSRLRGKQEVQELKGELAFFKQLVKEADETGHEADGTIERVKELEEELAVLKREMREMPTTAEPSIVAPDVSPSTPTSITFENNGEADGFLTTGFDQEGHVRDECSTNAARISTEVATQVSLSSPAEADTFRSARLSLEYLFPGEIPLGLNIEDPKPILDTMIDRLQHLKGQAMLTANELSVSKTQEANLRNQFNAVLQQLDRARNHSDTICKELTVQTARSDQAQRQAQQLEYGLNLGTEKIKSLESDLDQKQRSIQKLQTALETYRVEVSKLEALINKLEGEHAKAMSELRTEMDEAVADLECHVAAETTGRRAAEKETVEREEKIKQLGVIETELKGAVNEKQKIIREMERQIAQHEEGREREIGGMNVKIGELTSSLESATSDLAKVDKEKQRLLHNLDEEKAAGIRAVEAVQAELARCMEKIHGVKEEHVRSVQTRGAEVEEHRGLLTPVSACKFKDVEGYVEVKRGKGMRRRRPDSGIGVLEEDEMEDEDGGEDGDGDVMTVDF